VGLNSLNSLSLNNKNKSKNNKVKSKPLELYELAGKNIFLRIFTRELLEHEGVLKASDLFM
jgi:hypothetical protein